MVFEKALLYSVTDQHLLLVASNLTKIDIFISSIFFWIVNNRFFLQNACEWLLFFNRTSYKKKPIDCSKCNDRNFSYEWVYSQELNDKYKILLSYYWVILSLLPSNYYYRVPAIMLYDSFQFKNDSTLRPVAL